jgi:transcriptional regulator with XRE-family HTH domain
MGRTSAVRSVEKVPLENLVARLIELRRDLGFSQHDLAERMDVAQPSVSSFERRGTNPTLASVQRYADGLGIRITVNLNVPGRRG